MNYKHRDAYNFNLPEHLIATEPNYKRSECRLMTLNKKLSTIEHKHFFDILDYINENDLLILNDTKVINARVFFKKSTGGDVEILLLQKIDKSNSYWQCLVNGRKIKEGDTLYLNFKNIKIEAKIIKSENAVKSVLFSECLDSNMLEIIGNIPLPPYIIQNRKRKSENEYNKLDAEFYQNVYAKNEGSIASPTSGLHFTKELLENIRKKGVAICCLTLHIGFSTFNPLKEDNLEDHLMHNENFIIPEQTAKLICEYKKNKQRIVSCGTTVARVLESEYDNNTNSFNRLVGGTDIFIYPPYKFKCVDAMITNFHTPKSTLLAMVSAFAGYENVTKTYKEAVDKQYNFFSYGDAMFIY